MWRRGVWAAVRRCVPAGAWVAVGLCLSAGPALAGATQDLELSGFVDASYFHDFNAAAGEFGLDQVEVDVVHRASRKTRLRADLEWLKDGNDFVAQVEQAFMEYRCDGGVRFTFGRFNAPIGFEALDPNEMYQYSHSLVFDYGLPTNLTGAMVGADLGDDFDALAYAVNGWDLNTETNKSPTVGGRVGWHGETFGGHASAIHGRDTLDGGVEGDRTVWDVDLSGTPEGWVLGAEANVGSVDAGGMDSKWVGFLVMAHRDFNDRTGLTVRLDRFDDQDGYVFGLVGGEAQVRSAVTVAPTFVLDEGFGALVELRVDRSDQDAFVDSDGMPTDTSTTLAGEMTYSW